VSDVRATLAAAAVQPAPPIDPTFVQRLEQRLVAAPAEVVRPRRRWAFPAVAAAVTLAALAAGVVLGRGSDGDDRVQTIPPAASTTATSSAPSSTTSTTTGTTTTAAPPPSTTTTSPTIASQDLRLRCSTDPGAPSITCTWDGSTSAAFARFELRRHTGDGPTNVVYRGDRTEFTEASLRGARWFYDVVAMSADGAVLGAGSTTVTCC